MKRVAHSCCSAAGVFVVMSDGSMWWRKHSWLGDLWQPVAPPAGIVRTGPEAKRPGVGVKTGLQSRRSRR